MHFVALRNDAVAPGFNATVNAEYLAAKPGKKPGAMTFAATYIQD